MKKPFSIITFRIDSLFFSILPLEIDFFQSRGPLGSCTVGLPPGVPFRFIPGGASSLRVWSTRVRLSSLLESTSKGPTALQEPLGEIAQ